MEIPSIVPNPLLEDFPELYWQASPSLSTKSYICIYVGSQFNRSFSEKFEASRDICIHATSSVQQWKDFAFNLDRPISFAQCICSKAKVNWVGSIKVIP